MATGVPKKKKRTPTEPKPSLAISLSYAGKTDAAEILLTKPGNYISCWSSAEGSTSPRPENRLYFGENLRVLAKLLEEPDIRKQVRLVYIDPPFATQTVFHSRHLTHAYEDTLAGPEFLEFLRTRLILLREILAEDGSIYVHLDEKMVFHAKVLLDEIFGACNFRNCIVRKKCTSKNYTRKTYGKVIDYLLFYTKTNSYVWNKPLEPWTKARAKEYQYLDEPSGRRFMKVPVHAPGIRNGETGKAWRGMLPPPGKHWQFPPATLDEMDARGDIFWSSNGNPRRKIYLDQNPGIGVSDLWLDFRDAHNQNIQITGYPTEKNPDLLQRIITASSNPGDLVLDCFSGSATTLAAAEQLGRKWIGVDNSAEAIKTSLRRFSHGTEKMGDFVSLRNGGTNGRGESHSQVSLFPASQMRQFTGTTTSEHKVPKFSLLCEPEGLDRAKSIVAEWKDKTSSAASPLERTPARRSHSALKHRG